MVMVMKFTSENNVENKFKTVHYTYDLTKEMKSILTETKKDLFALMVMKFTSENNFENNFKAVHCKYDLTKQMKSILTETKEEEDQNVIDLTDPTKVRFERFGSCGVVLSFAKSDEQGTGFAFFLVGLLDLVVLALIFYC